jgi:hypothetical protein
VQIARGTKATAIHAKMLERCHAAMLSQGVLGVKAEHVEVSGRGASSEFRGCYIGVSAEYAEVSGRECQHRI